MERFILADYHLEYMDDKDLAWQTTDFNKIHNTVKSLVDDFATNYGSVYDKVLEENIDHFEALIDNETGIVYTGDDRGGHCLKDDVCYYLGA